MCIIISSFIQNANDDVFKQQQKQSPNRSITTGGAVQRDKITVQYGTPCSPRALQVGTRDAQTEQQGGSLQSPPDRR